MKKMIKTRMIAIMACCVASIAMFGSCGSSVEANFGRNEFTQEEMRAKPFNKIEMDGVMNVYYTQNDGDSCGVRIDYASIKDKEVRDEYKRTLRLGYKEGKLIITQVGSRFKNKNQTISIYVTSPDLLEVEHDGVGKFYAEKINSDRFEVSNDGVGEVRIKHLLANTVDVSNDGVGSVNIEKLQGDVVEVSNDGVGSTKLDNVKCKNLSIDNDGVGSVKAHVDCDKLDVSLDGVGSVKLSGVTRELKKHRDGVGSISISDLQFTKEIK